MLKLYREDTLGLYVLSFPEELRWIKTLFGELTVLWLVLILWLFSVCIVTFEGWVFDEFPPDDRKLSFMLEEYLYYEFNNYGIFGNGLMNEAVACSR